MAIHIIQHGLIDLHSHYFNETLAWRQTLSGAGQAYRIYSHVSLSPALARETGAIPVFRLAPDSRMEANPALASLADFIDGAEMLADDLGRVLSGPFGPQDIVVIPYATERDLFGVALWLSRTKPPRAPRLAFIIHGPDLSWSIAPDRRLVHGDVSYWHYAGKRLALETQFRPPFIGVRDENLRTLLTNLLRMDTRHVPMSTFPQALPDGVVKDIDVGMVGEFRPERGSSGLGDQFVALATRHPRARFLLQVATAAQHTAIKNAAAGVDGRIELVTGNQPIDVFLRNVARCRLILLPYAASRYRMRSSGVLSVATGLGVPVAVPSNTWLSDRITAGEAAGYVFDQMTPDVLDRLVARPAAEQVSLLRIAADLAEPWRLRNSTTTVLNLITNYFQAQDKRPP
jgi:hypothetical protein